jgi:PleD family two-component response regulator
MYIFEWETVFFHQWRSSKARERCGQYDTCCAGGMFWKLLDRPRDRTVKKRYRIVIAEDHKILREELRSLLSSNLDLEIVEEAQDSCDAIRQINA